MIMVLVVVGVGVGVVVDAAAGVVTIGTLNTGVAAKVVGCEGHRTEGSTCN